MLQDPARSTSRSSGTDGLGSLLDAFGDTITRVARQVAREYAAREGYEVVTADDIEQSVYEQFLRSGMTAEALAVMDEPQGFIRQTARYYGAANQARAARRRTLVAFRSSDDSRDLGAALLRTRAGGVGEPEVEVLASEAILEAVAGVQALLDGLRSPIHRRVASLCYLDGMDSYEVAERTGQSPAAVRKALQRAREHLGASTVAVLWEWRAFAHPDAKRPRRVAP